jgi:hypothetical protein
MEQLRRVFMASTVLVIIAMACSMLALKPANAGTVSRCADGTYSDVCVTRFKQPQKVRQPTPTGRKTVGRRSLPPRGFKASPELLDRQRRLMRR